MQVQLRSQCNQTIFRMSDLADEQFDASCVGGMVGGRQLIALLALSASPSDCFFAPGSPLQRLVLDFARLLPDFFFTFPFIPPSP